MSEPTEKQKVGQLGEDIATKYLESKGFRIIERNYLRKYGEIDIVAQKGGIVHFVEVKSVSCESFVGFAENIATKTSQYRPEDNLHPKKLKRLANVIQAYLFAKYQKGEPEWVFDAIIVRLDMKLRNARVSFLENLIL
jgi:putative endonuclease